MKSRKIMILGKSGTGKSRSLKNMDPKTTFLIKAVGKELPFRGEEKKFKIATKEKKGNMIITDDFKLIPAIINKINISKEYSHIRNLIIDDFIYIMVEEFMLRAYEKGYDKFTELGVHAWDIMKKSIENLRSDLNFIMLSQSELGADGMIKFRTIGKLIDEKVIPEGLFTIVLHTKVTTEEYLFQTQCEGTTTAKSPEEMFEKYIPNDLQAVLDRMEEYYSEDIQEPTAAKKEGESDVLTNPEAEEESIRGTELQEFSNFIHN